MDADFKRGARVEGEDASGDAACFAAETTEAGCQTLVPGVQPITQRDRLSFLAAAPLVATKPQRRADFGLFDLNARNQLELFGKRLSTKEQRS